MRAFALEARAQLRNMITIILTLILLHASGVTAGNCKNYAKKAEYNVFKIKAECGTKKCISPSSQSRIKAYNDDLEQCNKNIKNLKCKQKRIDPPVTPRACTKCDDLQTESYVIIGHVESTIYRKKCMTHGDMSKVHIYERSFETCRKESTRLRCKQTISKPSTCPAPLCPDTYIVSHTIADATSCTTSCRRTHATSPRRHTYTSTRRRTHLHHFLQVHPHHHLHHFLQVHPHHHRHLSLRRYCSHHPHL